MFGQSKDVRVKFENSAIFRELKNLGKMPVVKLKKKI